MGCAVTPNRSKRPPPGAGRPDRTIARKPPLAGARTTVGKAATRTEGWAGEIDGADGRTHNTSAHKPATATPATNRRHHIENSSIAQLVVMPVFMTDTL